MLEALALGSLGRAHLLAGDLDEARRVLQRTAQSPGAQYTVYRIHVLGSQALVEAWTGRLDAAQRLAEEALLLARDVQLLLHPAPADAYLALSLVAIHRGRPQAAAFERHEGTVRAASNLRSQLEWVAYLHTVLAGEPPSPEREPVKPPPPIVRDALQAAAHRAQRFAGATGSALRPTRSWSPLLVEAVSDALTHGRPAEARAMLDAASFAPRDDLPLASVEHGILHAWLAQVEGRAADARIRLGRALALAEEYDIVSAFVWAGPELIRLVETHPAPPTPFRTRVLQAAREQLRTTPDESLTEPLTDRERELLAYLPTRLTNAELAARFYVSVNTIKTHMAHIYRKLDAPNRSAAVSRATELNLL
jgi:LuxR family maltose regulon positive regulatory protein